MSCSLKSGGQFIVASPCILLVMFYVGTLRLYEDVPIVNSVENSTCRWPPTSVNKSYLWMGGFDMSICVRPAVNAILNDDNKLYYLRRLFRGSYPWHMVSFEDLGELPRRVWKRVKYSNVYQTYPQDVPLRQLVNDIKAGNPVRFVRSMVFFLSFGHQFLLMIN
ncbi:hypothetical protein TSMEX_000582 [Taenia solium]|eukprot:TsM_000381400 transcript=TsM_000381400 gene=TsM_000381400